MLASFLRTLDEGAERYQPKGFQYQSLAVGYSHE